MQVLQLGYEQFAVQFAPRPGRPPAPRTHSTKPGPKAATKTIEKNRQPRQPAGAYAAGASCGAASYEAMRRQPQHAVDTPPSRAAVLMLPPPSAWQQPPLDFTRRSEAGKVTWWRRLKVAELKQLLVEKGLPTTGLKADLLKRLEEHAAGGDDGAGQQAPMEAAAAASVWASNATAAAASSCPSLSHAPTTEQQQAPLEEVVVEEVAVLGVRTATPPTRVAVLTPPQPDQSKMCTKEEAEAMDFGALRQRWESIYGR